MSKVIIGIHGLGNKPPEDLLYQWWRTSINEGLARIGSPRLKYQFELVYWAGFLHSTPLQVSVDDPDDPLYLEDPYVPSGEYYLNKPNANKRKWLDYLEKQIDRLLLNDDLSINFSAITDMIINHFFHDLEVYYEAGKDKTYPARTAIQDKLRHVLLKHRNDDILLIAHSMGTIIAYEVIQQLRNDIKIHTFMTFGSPLGIPVIMSKIYKGLKKSMPALESLNVPENITHAWYNFSDLNDRVALNYNLADDYPPNSRGLAIQDFQVHNDYVNRDHANPHKSYGYLRIPEAARIIREHIDAGKNPVQRWLNRALDRLLRLFSGKYPRQI